MSRGIGIGMRKVYLGENSLLGKESRLNIHIYSLSLPKSQWNDSREIIFVQDTAYKDKENRKEKTKAMQY